MPPGSDDESGATRATPSGADGFQDDRALLLAFQAQVARYCPSWLTSSIDDIAQVAWMRLRDAQRRNERNRNPGSSLIAKVAYCATIDEIRRRRRRPEVRMERSADMVPTETLEPTQALAAREIGAGIRLCLDRLLPNRRRAVTLYLQGHSAPHTGRILDWSLKRAENMIFRGMADLRRCLSEKGIEP